MANKAKENKVPLEEITEALEKVQENTITTEIEMFNSVVVKIHRTVSGVIPMYAHKDNNGNPMDVCMDLTAIDMEYNEDFDYYAYRTGLQIEVPQGFGAFILPRSSNRKTDAYLCNAPGVCDYGYAGDYTVCFKNRTSIIQIIKNKQLDAIKSAIEDCASLYDLKKRMERGLYSVLAEDVKSIGESFAPYQVGDRIAQLVILPYPFVQWKEVDEIPDLRGGGFGSTGK